MVRLCERVFLRKSVFFAYFFCRYKKSRIKEKYKNGTHVETKMILILEISIIVRDVMARVYSQNFVMYPMVFVLDAVVSVLKN